MSKKAWIIFATVCVLLLGSLVAYSNSKKVNVGEVDANKIQTTSEASGNIADHVFGKPDSKVVLVEYGDFQCPGCGGMHPTVKSVTEKYKGQLTFVFRNFPLTQIHPNALVAAAAAEAAGLQGKYWEMHNALFEKQDAWKSASVKNRIDVFTQYAKALNLDVNKFGTDIASESVTKKINYDLAIGKKINVSSTPTFVLNGKMLTQDEWGDPAKFEALIVAQLKQNGIALPGDTKE
ncbi:MAG: Na+/H+ antiporter, NhaA family protein nonfunctional [Candidatus Saccharibacteria bacterium]|nr:Na+/H+ antiporter, NhaA family protein nonfunctional [Candidatus Saccharibacteria bacterium]